MSHGLSPKEFVAGYKNTSAVLDYALRSAREEFDVEDSVEEVCDLREYSDDDPIRDLLTEMGLVWMGDGGYLTKPLVRNPFFGVFNKSGFFMLKDRWAVPIRDMDGKTVALVGWNKAASLKYMTTKTEYFRRELDFFQQENLVDSRGKDAVILEGIFDTLHARAYGLNAYGVMGLNVTKKRTVLYGLMGKVLGVPDNDSGGQGVISRDKWSLSSRRGSTYAEWGILLDKAGLSGNDRRGVKDVDDLLVASKNLGADAVREQFSRA